MDTSGITLTIIGMIGAFSYVCYTQHKKIQKLDELVHLNTKNIVLLAKVIDENTDITKYNIDAARKELLDTLAQVTISMDKKKQDKK